MADRFAYDLDKHKIVPVIESVTGLCGFMSFDRLAELFRSSGEISKKERLTHFRIGDDGITFRMEYV